MHVPNTVQEFNAFNARLVRYRFMGLAGGKSLLDMVRAGTAENDDIQQGVRTEAIGPVNGDAGGFASGVKSWNHFVNTVIINGKDLAGVFGRDTTH